MDTARLSSKGQVTIPIDIRRKLGLRAGENVIFIEKSGNVLITSESKIIASESDGLPKEIAFRHSRFAGIADEAFSEPENFHTKDKRREILRSLYGSINDPTLVEPPEVEYESPRDWELLDQ